MGTPPIAVTIGRVLEATREHERVLARLRETDARLAREVARRSELLRHHREAETTLVNYRAMLRQDAVDSGWVPRESQPAVRLSSAQVLGVLLF